MAKRDSTCNILVFRMTMTLMTIKAGNPLLQTLQAKELNPRMGDDPFNKMVKDFDEESQFDGSKLPPEVRSGMQRVL